MKANELRIGNLIEYKLNSGSHFIEVNTYLLTVIDVGKKPFIDRYKPIPLTTDWLIDLGFRYWDDLDQWYSPDNDAELRINHFTEGERIGFFEEEYYTKLEYVHQLQNLYFALTSNELQIKR